jgi:hypothetical protein
LTACKESGNRISNQKECFFMNRDASECGNALFLVLIGVVLMAALAYAVTQGGRGKVEGMATQEQARLTASEVIQYGNGLRPIIDRMMLLGGVTDTTVNFAASGANASYGTAGTNPTKEVFNLSGGGVPYTKPPTAACLSTCAYEFSGQYTVSGLGSASPELAMLVIDIPKAVCDKINTVLNFSWASAPTGGALTLARFDGTNYGTSGVTLTGGSNELVGQRAFCYRESGGAQRYIYVHVIRSR